MSARNKFLIFLETEFSKRKKENSSYSKRAYARDLGLSKTLLHDILCEKRGCSKQTVAKVADSLKLPLVRLEKLLHSFEGRKKISRKDFSKIFHWYCFAILNLAETVGARGDIPWIADRLGLSLMQVEKALASLKELNLIEVDKGGLVRKVEYLNADWNVSSSTLKRFHSENLDRANKALFEVPIDKREFTSITSTVSEGQYHKIKAATKKYREEIFRITQEKEESREVYTVAVQIFPQTQTFNRKEE